MKLVKKIVPSSLLLFVFCTACSTEAKTEPKHEPGATGGLSEAEFKKLHELRGDKAPAPKGEMIEIPGAKAYLSLPKGAKPPLPGIVVIHEWWGLNEHIKHWTDRLADEGYAALAVDLYGGKVADNPNDAMKYMRAVDQKAALDICKYAEMFLRDDGRIQAQKTACIGWCFGGGQSLQMALNIPTLSAVVIYYGQPVYDLAKLKAIQAPMLAIFGNKDRSFTPERVNRFEKALKEAGRTYQILRYDANHAFANPSSARYDQKAATEAWKHVREFLAKNLK